MFRLNHPRKTEKNIQTGKMKPIHVKAGLE